MGNAQKGHTVSFSTWQLEGQQHLELKRGSGQLVTVSPPLHCVCGECIVLGACDMVGIRKEPTDGFGRLPGYCRGRSSDCRGWGRGPGSPGLILSAQLAFLTASSTQSVFPTITPCPQRATYFPTLHHIPWGHVLILSPATFRTVTRLPCVPSQFTPVQCWSGGRGSVREIQRLQTRVPAPNVLFW